MSEHKHVLGDYNNRTAEPLPSPPNTLTVYRVLKHTGPAHKVTRALDRSVGGVDQHPELERFAQHEIEELYRGEQNPLPIMRFDCTGWRHHRAEMTLYRVAEFDPWPHTDIVDAAEELFDMLLFDVDHSRSGLVL